MWVVSTSVYVGRERRGYESGYRVVGCSVEGRGRPTNKDGLEEVERWNGKWERWKWKEKQIKNNGCILHWGNEKNKWGGGRGYIPTMNKEVVRRTK